MKNYTLLIIALLLFICQNTAQKLILHKLDFNEELDIIGLTQYKDGSIWFITNDKLLSFDGHSLEQKCKSTKADGRITKLFNIDQNLFVGTKSGLILHFESDSLVERITIEGQVTDMIKLTENEYLISSNGGGIFRFNPNSNTVSSISTNVELQLTNDLQIVGDEIYFATDRGLFRSDIGMETFHSVKPVGNRIINNLCYRGDSVLWISEFKTFVHQLDVKSQRIQTISLKNESRIDNLSITQNRLFASTKQGLFHYDLTNFDHLIQSDEYHFIKDSSDPINTTYVDDEGNFWIGSTTGLTKSTLLFSKLNLPISSSIHALLYKNNNLFLGTDQGLFVTDYLHNDSLIQLNNVNITSLDAYENTIVVGTYADGLHIYNASESDKKLTAKHTYPFENSVLAVKFLSETELVVATLSGVKIMTKVNNTWGISEEIKMLDSYYILSIFKSKNNNIWFGTDKKGLLKYDFKNVERFSTTTNSDPIKSVYSIIEDFEGNIWASSNELGLIKQSPDGFSNMKLDLKEMGPYTAISMTRDSLMFLIGVKDIAIFNPSNNEFISYKDEILITPKESFLNNYCKTENHVVFEHHGALYQLNENKTNRTQPLISLEEVQVNLETIDTSNHVFGEQENNFSFHYKGILMRNPASVSYTYKLDGFDDEWRFTNDRTVTYPHLGPGKYDFIVRSSVLGEVNSSVHYQFTINQALYKRWWFISSCLMLVFWISWLWTRKNRKEKEIRNQLILQKTETQLSNLKSQLNPHFLFNSFNTVIGLIEEDQEKSIEYIEQLTDFFRLVLDTGEEELIPIETELKLMDAYSHLLKERFQLGLDINIIQPFSDSLIPPLSLQLLVENAVKHNVISKSQPLIITIQEEVGYLVVENNFNPKKVAEPSMGIGLSNLRSRYQLIAKKIIVVNQNEKKMTVKLPLIKSNKKI